MCPVLAVIYIFTAWITVGQTNPFSVQPTNTYGIVGGNVSLGCGVTDGTQIFLIQPDGQSVADSVSGVYSGFENKYTLTNQGTTYTLTLLSAAFTDEGRYSCNSPPNNAASYAEIIILGGYFSLQWIFSFQEGGNFQFYF